jgi:hypothetical protein
MPLPSKNKDEDKNAFVSRCMSDEKMKSEYPDQKQRTAICIQRATADCGCIEAADFQIQVEAYGYEEEVTEENFYVPSEDEYVTSEEVDFEQSEVEEWDISIAKPGLWENIRKKKEREGKNYKPAKKGDPDRPDPEAWKKAQSSDDNEMARQQLQKMHDQLMAMMMKIPMIEFEDWTKDMISKAEIYVQNVYDFVQYYKPEVEDDMEDENEESLSEFKYEDPKTGEVYTYKRRGVYKKNGRTLIPAEAAEYQGKKVQLGKPFRTPKGPKKFSVYVKNDKGNVVKVNFGDPNMKIKKNIPERRKSFRARHNCDNPGPRWKARYWSCKAW